MKFYRKAVKNNQKDAKPTKNIVIQLKEKISKFSKK